jgi:hypothetical protein
MSQLWERRTKKEFEGNPGTNPILFICNISAFILYLQVMQLVRDCTVHIAVGHSWLAKLLTLVECLKICVKN